MNMCMLESCHASCKLSQKRSAVFVYTVTVVTKLLRVGLSLWLYIEEQDGGGPRERPACIMH